MDVDMLSKGEACLWLSCNRQCVVFSPGNRYNRNKWWGKGNVGTSVQLPRGRVFDNVSVQFPIISPQKRGLKRRLFFLSFVHAKDRKMDSTLSAPCARFCFIRDVKTWPRWTSHGSPRAHVLHCMQSSTDWQRGGRLNTELSVGVFVPWEHTHFFKLQGSFKTTRLVWRTCFRGKKNTRFFASGVVYIRKWSLFLTQIAV